MVTAGDRARDAGARDLPRHADPQRGVWRHARAKPGRGRRPQPAPQGRRHVRRERAHRRFDPGSLAAEAVGEHVHIARCHHHQAVLDLGDGLVVTGHAESDGVTEAIELANGSWALGVQWHPEAEDRSRLFGALVDAGREYASTSSVR